ncbi:aminotransferase class I/II-fold pyridoxal phosphate-dependent enzyme [Nocardia sp. NPDC052566]|uniref:aminotransferase class I/II-fold pyridoxal phosphate-dependent enzyme n=1 Tax=Nocardia sp. NPDC052566 TaxID=3364330 RepID=UPI0037C6BD06
MNTVPFRPWREIVEAVALATTVANEYPDLVATETAAALAAQLGVPDEHVLIGPGSAAVCQLALFGWCAPGDEVVHQWPSFEGYPLMIGHANAHPVPVALRGTDTDLDDIAAAVTDRTRMVLLCNPNNPTGALLTRDELRRLLDRLPEHVTVLIDEVYRDFVLAPTYRDAVGLVGDDPRVAVLRSFSKSYGLAGLRIGYLIAQPALLDRLGTLRLFFAASAQAQAAALTALGHVTEMRRRCAEIGAERARLREMLWRQGWPVPVSHANFLWVPTPQAVELADHCAAHGIAVRAWSGRGVRVTVGTEAANDAFAGLADDFRGSLRPSAS